MFWVNGKQIVIDRLDECFRGLRDDFGGHSTEVDIQRRLIEIEFKSTFPINLKCKFISKCFTILEDSH